ncbi:NADPH oxidase organizer 1a [Brachionichthys hirsutus]|uniref:NADPH oxidase organizer 1a n=1 Tax=Brachionichthys hirsutus TaxID=412623 RepID=UPI003604B54A
MDGQRYPISVRLVGVIRKEIGKMYIASVLWSDKNEIVVYRTFAAFESMHKQLKKSFPSGSKMKKSDRVIPKFRDKHMLNTKQKKGTGKSLERRKFLQSYCDDLLNCGPRVCQSPEVVQFFHPNDQDLQPEFTKSGILIMLSDDEIRPDAGPASISHVTQPFVTETYRCVAAYETKDTKNKPFKVAADEKVDVLIKDKGGWWLVEKEDKQMAWFPAPYLEKLEDDLDDEDEIDGSFEKAMSYTAIKNYKATKSDEISVAIGSVVEVLLQSDNGWWLIRHNGKTGYIPTMYLQPNNNNSSPRLRLTASQLDLSVPSPNPEPQSPQLSSSQSSLPPLPLIRSPSPGLRPPEARQRSNSLTVLGEMPRPLASPRNVRRAARTPSPMPSRRNPPPKITVEMDEDERSYLSDSSELSFSDDFSSSSESSALSLTQSLNEQQLRHRDTPQPRPRSRLSTTSSADTRLSPSLSDANLFKYPASPKVPPRPHASEIRTRCSTVTRKNAAKSPSPTQAPLVIL